jgi:glutamine synthetase
MLEKQAAIYQKYDVFPAALLEGIEKGLKRFDDANLRNKISGNEEEIMKLVEKFFHCG